MLYSARRSRASSHAEPRRGAAVATRERGAGIPNTTLPSGTFLAARGVSRRFGYRTVLTDVSLELDAGDALLLVGSNGAGKTTLLRVLAGLLRPTTGEVARRVPLGMVAHDAMLYPALTARENLRFFARLWGRTPGTRIDHVLRLLGLERRADDVVGTFSRGMIQRLAIARALLHEPRLLLFDEPLSSLDQDATDVVLELLTAFRDAGGAMVIVTHQPAGMASLATREDRLEQGRLASRPVHGP